MELVIKIISYIWHAPLTCLVLTPDYPQKTRPIQWLLTSWPLVSPEQKQPRRWLYDIMIRLLTLYAMKYSCRFGKSRLCHALILVGKTFWYNEQGMLAAVFWANKDSSSNNTQTRFRHPDSKVHGANMGPIWGRRDPGGPHVGPMNFAIWADLVKKINQRLAKRPLKTNGRLVDRGLSSLVKEATGFHVINSYSSGLLRWHWDRIQDNCPSALEVTPEYVDKMDWYKKTTRHKSTQCLNTLCTDSNAKNPSDSAKEAQGQSSYPRKHSTEAQFHGCWLSLLDGYSLVRNTYKYRREICKQFMSPCGWSCTTNHSLRQDYRHDLERQLAYQYL